MSSIDGRIVVERWTEPFDKQEKNALVRSFGLINEHINVEAYIEGRKTVQTDFCPGESHLVSYTPVNRFENFIAKKNTDRYFVVLDPDGKIFYDDDNIRGNNIITVLGEQISGEYLDFLRQRNISYIFAGKDGKDLNKMLSTLKKDFGINTLLLQGGGIINGSFLKAGLIDEVSLMIYPGIDGLKDIPALFDYTGKDEEFPAAGQSLELLSCKPLENGVIWAYYKVHHS
jgi:riboflavin biosynthesis pyrimidine reductase